MLIRQVALVADDTGGPSPRDISRAAAALQKQATRDFGPLWQIQATVDGFASLDDVPLGYWPIIVGQENQNGGGVHLDDNGQPYALVDYTSRWTLAASHECHEMLADPFGNRLVISDSLKEGQGRVQYLLEVGDPCEAPQFGYTVNGVLVSDFYTPHFFDPSPANPAVRYSFRGHIKEPRQVLQGGYISWIDPVTNHWFQKLYFGSAPEIVDQGPAQDTGTSLREFIDRKTFPMQREIMTKAPAAPNLMMISMRHHEPSGEDRVSPGTQAIAKSLRAQIQKVRKR